jgi:hypothetical protein
MGTSHGQCSLGVGGPAIAALRAFTCVWMRMRRRQGKKRTLE